VTEVVLVGVTMTRRSEIHWLYRGIAPLFPEEWVRFRGGVPEREPDGDLVEAYYRLLHHPDPAVRAKAAKDWHEWEAALLSVDPNARPPPQWSQPDFRMARARIVTHYFRHHAWLEDDILLRKADALRGIPGILVHGRLDLGSPLVTAWELARAWPNSELVIVRGAGHSSADPGMSEAAIAATDRFART
jgi:proline iminopeptidase